ncbi:MAG: pentapeptide repeat-containing protein, partial [Flavobacteriaceae bacterium]
TSAVGEAIVEEALEAIGPISLTFSVGGGDLTIEAEGLTKGSMDFAKGDLAFGFDAELGSTPGIGFNYSKGPGSLSFEANAAGSFGVGLGLDGKSLSLGIQGTNEGYLDLTYDDVSFATRINRSNKTGTLAFAYGDKSIDFGVETDGGYLNLELSSDLKFETGFNTAGSAYLGLAAGTNEFSISGDKESGEGSFDLSIDGLAMNTSVNTLEKSASFALNTSGVTLDVSGEYGKGGSFLLDVSDTRIDVGADLEDNTGHIDLVSGDKRLFAELTESSQGSLLLKNGEQEFGISGNTEGTAGSVHYKDNTAEFTIAADRTNNTGNIALSFDDKVLASGVTEDSSYINIAFSDVELNVQSNNQNKGMIEVIKGSNQIKVDADLEEKSGSLLLTDGANSIYAKGAANATGELDISIDNNTVRGVVGEMESSLFVSSGEYEFSIEGSDDGSGLIGFKKGNIETRLGVNIPQTAGEIYVGDGGDFIHLKGNKTENTGLVDIKKSNLEFTAILDDSIHMYSGPASLTRRSDGTGFMRYNDGNLGVGLYKYSSEIGLGLGYAGSQLYLSHGTSTDFDSVYYNGNGQTVSASIAGNTGRIGLTNSLGSFGLSANTSGAGSISFARGDLDVTVTGDINNESGGFEFEKGDLKMDGSASLSSESFGIGFEKGNIVSDLDYSPTLQRITFGLTNDFSISAQKEDDAYTTVFTKGDHSLKGTVQGSLKEIEYEGMGAKVILGNDREYVSYSGHSLLVQNKKVYVDDEEVYDYSNASMTDVLDLRKVDFSQLDLSGVDFSGIDLSAVDISGIDFSALDFSSIDLDGIDFSGIDFSGIDLSSIDFSGIDLSGMDLSSLNFTGFSMSDINLSGIDFSGIDLSGIT